jgi:MFS transporter, DHA1 family, multidrug resistance protein
MVWLLAAVMSLQALAIDAMLPALPMMAAELGADEANSRQLVIGLYMLFNGLGCLIPGMLADRYGRRPVALVALGFYVAFSLGCALVTDFTALLVIRCLQGAFCSALSVVPTAIVRDRYEGDRMARLMSLISAVFICVPILAPVLGQGVLLVAGWRWIFVALAVWGALVGLWFWRSMPETLHPEFRQEIEPHMLLVHARSIVLTRSSAGYMLAAALIMSGIFGYVNSAQQLLGEHFGAGEAFTLVFSGTIAAMMLANIVNARIVTRFGARRVSHAGLLAFITISAAQVWFAFGPWQSLAWFLPLMGANVALLGFLGANFSAIAMQPFGEFAGAASSIQLFVRLVGSSLLAILIGQAYDGTSRPIAVALLASGCLSLVLILFSERGRLFRRLNPPKGKPR